MSWPIGSMLRGALRPRRHASNRVAKRIVVALPEGLDDLDTAP
jgi:hypothetical protein